MSLKIAIQGIKSSFHHLAVQQLFPETEIELVPCTSFDDVAKNITNLNADLGVIAIENTIAGSILPNYELIDANNLKILEETFLVINMYLMALEGETLHTIDEVHSHPVALQQCKKYLRRLQPHCKIIEGKDTAFEARRIKENKLKGVAAIAGKQVAEEFGLKILGSNIQTIKDNKTRFVVIGRPSVEVASGLNKATLKFQLGHNVGSLSNVLQLLSTFGINLTKIQSFPIEGKPWEYSFYIDVLFENLALFEEVTTVLKKAVSQLRILGIYKQNLENSPSSLSLKTSYGK
jgi:prephenate dehydratase